MRKIKVLIIACTVVLLAVLALLWPSGRAGPSEVRVTFCGFTNDTRGLRLATFQVSNTGGVSLFRWPGYEIEERGGAGPRSGGSYKDGVLTPGESSICLLPAPSSSTPWRAVFLVSDNNWKRKLVGLPWVRALLPTRLRSLPTREGKSDWVVDISPVAPTPLRQRAVVRLAPKPQQTTNAPAQAPGTNLVSQPP
jgi:hypothetical protein